MKTQNLKVVAYVRISSMRQIDNESLTTQKDSIQKYADENGIEIVHWFEDVAKSAKSADREGLQELLTYCLKHKGKINFWIVYNMRRASRDIDTYSSEVRLILKARGVSIRSATEPSVTDTKEGRFMENLLVSLGQLDNEGKAEVTVDNMRSLALQGYWQHPPIVGYDTYKVPNEQGKPRPTLRPNLMAPKVKETLVRFSKGDLSKAELSRFAEQIGLRSRYGKKLSKDRIHALLKHPVYAGFVSDNFTKYELVEGKHEPLISTHIYERNLSLLFPKNSRAGENHLKFNKDYPLKGVLLCVNCRKPLYASAPKTGNGGYSPRYHCSRKLCRGLVISIKARKVHDDFEELLSRVKPSPGVLKLYKQILIRQANKELGSLNGHIKTLREELSSLSSSRIKAVQKFTEGLLTIDEKRELVDLLDVQKLEKAENLKALEQQQSIREADIEAAINLMESVDRQWAESDISVQVRFQKMLFPDGLYYDSVNGRFGTSNISPLYRCLPNKKDSQEPSESFLVAGAGLEPATSWL